MSDDDDDDNISPPNSYGVNGDKFPHQNISHPENVGKSYIDEEVDDGDEEDDDDGGDGVQRIGKDDFECGDDDDDSTEEESGDLQRHPKKRKFKALLSSYEFAPRLLASSSGTASVPKPSYGGKNPLLDWTEHETSVLLDAWGERYLKRGRKSLRSEERQEVSEKVSQGSQIERTDTQCRNHLDTLKKKYKKEKTKLGENGNVDCKWIYFSEMDALLPSPPQQTGLSCGMESGEYVFADPRVYLNQSNGLDEMRDSPGNSESGGEDESEGLPPQRASNGRPKGGAASFKMLADSIHKFSEIYQKVEDGKREQMVELEKMRMDFHRDLDFHKRQFWRGLEPRLRRLDKEMTMITMLHLRMLVTDVSFI